MARTFEFGRFRLDQQERTLVSEGGNVALTPKAFDVLLVLLDNPGRLVEKSKLLETVWGGVYVDDAVLARAISDLRKALGQTETQVWIETVPKFGYRFVAGVQVTDSAQPVDPPRSPSPRRRVWYISAVGAAVVLAIMISRGISGPPENIHSLAILPFQAIGGTGEEGALRLGLADALITRLSGLDGLVVRPLSAVRRFEKEPVEPIQAARQLRADAVLEGTLQFGEGSVRASVRLIRAGDGKALWAETVESGANRYFAMEDALAEQLATNVALLLHEEVRRDVAIHRELNDEAHRLYVTGRYEWGKRTQQGLEKGAEYFREAIDRDPAYGRAYAGLADCYLLLGLFGYSPPLEMLPKAKVTALHALELDPTLAEAASLALIMENLDWDWKEAERQYREAIRLAPNYSTAHHWYAEFLSILGRFGESQQEFARAREIDPISPAIQVDEAQLYFFERQYDRNLTLLEKVSREDPSFWLARERMAFTYLMEGRDEDAWREAMSLPDCGAEASDCRRMWTAWLPRRNPSAARAALAQLEEEAKAGRVPAYTVMLGYVRQGDADLALDWLERMQRTHGVWLITAKVNPMFDPLRIEPRGRAVLAMLHLDQ